MDAFTQLALMAKAKKVFESADTFLSFPALQPLTFTPDRLKFVSGGVMTAQDLINLSEFARVTNRIPRGLLAPVEEGDYLWDAYDEVLRTAQVAAGNITAEEKAVVEKALALLYEIAEDGSRQDSAALTAYKQCRDAVVAAEEEYKNQESTASLSTDAAVLAQWKTETEPALRAALRQAEEAWDVQGRKGEIETALQVETAYAARMPSLTWQEWRTSFIRDLDLQTDTNQIQYAVTGFSPCDLFEIGEWPHFTLSLEEMQRLAAGAPPELRAIFGESATDTQLLSVSFEYRTVSVTRPWFRSQLFKSRFWRLGDAAEPLSDGARPEAHGRCPAYVAALVFARNIRVQQRAPQGKPPRPPIRLSATQLLNPALLKFKAPPLRHEADMLGPAAPFRRTMTPTRVLKPSPMVAPAATPPVMPMAARSLRAINFASRPELLLKPRPVPHPAPPPAAPAQPATSEVSVLAFICKWLPQCPNPDPTLNWV